MSDHLVFWMRNNAQPLVEVSAETLTRYKRFTRGRDKLKHAKRERRARRND